MVDVSEFRWTLVEAEAGYSPAAIASPDRDCLPSIRLSISNGIKNNSGSCEVKGENSKRAARGRKPMGIRSVYERTGS